MAIVSVQLSIAANNGLPDNKAVTPGGGDVYLQINRGFNCFIPNYQVDICRVISATQLQIETPKGTGQYPSAANPNGPAPLINLGAPAGLAGRCVVLQADGVSASTQVGQIDVIVGIYQLTGAVFRRVDWEADSGFAIQMQSRFNIQF